MEPFDGAPRLRTVADYQFGAGAGAALFPPEDDLAVTRSSSGRVQQVRADDGHVVSLAEDGRFTLGIAGGRRLGAALDPPRARVAVGAESDPYLRDGRNAFAKFVRGVDPEVRPGDEVLVVRPTDGTEPSGDDAADHRPEGSWSVEEEVLLAVGRAELPAGAMADFERGMAVFVRDGAGD